MQKLAGDIAAGVLLGTLRAPLWVSVQRAAITSTTGSAQLNATP